MTMRRCCICLEDKQLAEFSGPEYRCKPCNSKRVSDNLIHLRMTAVNALGDCCAKCGSTDDLEIDHPNGGGSIHRLNVGKATAYYKEIFQNINDYRLLCLPCNRPVVGSSNGNSKLSEQQVKEIRSKISGKYGEITQLATEYGVHADTIGRIKSGRIWGWL